jgi:signal transduction histidine kinase
MSRSSSADAVPPGALPAWRGAGSALAPRNWRVASRLIVMVAIPTVLGLALTGLHATAAMRSAEVYGQVSRLAMLSQQVTGLAQAMEDERTDTAAFIAAGRPAAGLPALDRQYAITDGWAVTARGLVLRLGRGDPARTRAGAVTVLASIAELPGLRRNVAQSRAPALAVINGYSAAIAGLFPVDDGTADLSGSSALTTSVRALGSLSRMKDQVSEQQAILGGVLAKGSFGPGELTALTIAQAQQASDLASFRSAATPEESTALTVTMARPLASQARVVEQRATAVSAGALALDAQASQQWRAGMSYTVGWMRHAEQQLTAWITAYAQARQGSAMRSAIVTAGAALAALILVLLITLIMVRSLVRPLRRLEAAALDVAGAGLPAEVRALGAAGNSGPRLLAPIDVQATDEIGQVARAFDQVHREAVRLAGEEARLRGSVSAIASFFRRSHSLLEPLLRLIDNLELGEDDPERLASLFQVDHLATRLRRNSDSALVLARHETPHRWTEPVTLVDVLRAAASEIEQYDRVVLSAQQGVSVSGSAAADTVHLLAELLDNAITFSAQTTQVIVSGHTVRGDGALISITDSGKGMPEEELRRFNWQLTHPHLADVTVARHVGLFTVAQLAARHGIWVTLGLSPGGGITAEVHLPATLIAPEAKPGGWPGPAAQALSAGAGRGAVAVGAAADPWPSAARFPAGPESAEGPRIATPDDVPLTLGVPLPSPVPPASFTPTVPEPAGAELGGALPIFESVESDYFQTRGQGLHSPSEPPASPPTPAGQPTAAWAATASAADSWRAAAADATAEAGARTSGGLPQRIPWASSLPGDAADQQTGPAPAAESAQIALDRLASFQRGSRRARADRDAKQSSRDD